MNQEIKQQVFDVLDKGGYEAVVWVKSLLCDNWTNISYSAHVKIMRATRPSRINDIIPDDIETRMLDWLYDEEFDYNLIRNEDGLYLYLKYFNGNSTTIECDTPRIRPVAIAEACVWVYQQLKEAE